MYIITGKTFKHYKGGSYIIRTTATHTETGEGTVVYTDGINTWDRPRKMFFGETLFGDYAILRFEEGRTWRDKMRIRKRVFLNMIRVLLCKHKNGKSDIPHHDKCVKCGRLEYIGE